MMRDERVVYTKIFGCKYPLCLTVSASEKVEKVFGSIGLLLDSLRSDDAKQVANNMLQLAEILMEGGRERVRVLANIAGEPFELPPNVKVAEVYPALSLGESAAFSDAVTQAFLVGFKQTVEVGESPKNVETTQSFS